MTNTEIDKSLRQLNDDLRTILRESHAPVALQNTTLVNRAASQHKQATLDRDRLLQAGESLLVAEIDNIDSLLQSQGSLSPEQVQSLNVWRAEYVQKLQEFRKHK